MTITFSRPLTNENFGVGFNIAVATSLPSIPFNSRWFGRLVPTVLGIAHSQWVLGATTALGVSSVWGFDYRFNQTTIFEASHGSRHGASATCIVQLFNNVDQVIDSGQVSVIIDDISGIPYLVSHWSAGSGGGGAHDPMLDQILAAVQQVYSLPT